MITHLEIAEFVRLGYAKHTDRSLEVEFLFSEYEEDIVITFRGTEASRLITGSGWRDWLRNLMVWTRTDPRVGRAHAGFLSGAQRASTKVIQLLEETGLTGTRLHVAGHSLGGGMSLPAAQILKSQGLNVYQWVGFGTPKIYKQPFPDFRFRCTSYRYGNDRVTQLPFKWMGFRHTVPITQLGDSSGNKGTWKDHSIEQYIQALHMQALQSTMFSISTSS